MLLHWITVPCGIWSNEFTKTICFWKQSLTMLPPLSPISVTGYLNLTFWGFAQWRVVQGLAKPYIATVWTCIFGRLNASNSSFREIDITIFSCTDQRSLSRCIQKYLENILENKNTQCFRDYFPFLSISKNWLF